VGFAAGSAAGAAAAAASAGRRGASTTAAELHPLLPPRLPPALDLPCCARASTPLTLGFEGPPVNAPPAFLALLPPTPMPLLLARLRAFDALVASLALDP
jgi:hypothetical protein